MAERYEPKTFEDKWRQRWAEAELFKTREEPGHPKFYALDFFPYPSGAGLSVGHCRNYVPTDVLARMKYMQGYNVLHPMGFDAFGLPAENEAIAKKTHPAPMVQEYGETYHRQMDLIGVSYDWSRSFFSSDPDYYKWTQWIFKLLYERGLAYQKLAAVNWCPKDKTVLADEEVVGGLCWRCNTPVEKRLIPQWFFKITEYAQRLIDDLDLVEWPDGIKNMQRNWIGRSEGVEFAMQVFTPSLSTRSVDGEGAGGGESVSDQQSAISDQPAESKIQNPKSEIEPDFLADFEVRPKERQLNFRVFTTRIDTIFGMTFCVLAPEHPLVEQLMKMVEPEHVAAMQEYRENAKRLSDTDRQATNREKTGVFTGAYAINPANGKKVPIWIADYVLATYGTGAIMAVPGHDERDFEFAQKFGLEVKKVITLGDDDPELPFESKDGRMTNSGEYDGLTFSEGTDQLGEWIEGLGIGERKVTYRLRDWLISRQRYWGCPIPMIHTKDGEMHPASDDQLPVLLPEVENYEPAGDGSSPLSQIPEFLNVTDKDGTLGRRETDTMGGFACSSWYFLRFCDPFNDEKAWDLNKAKYWMPVDCYVGGAEHAVMHLLYARFWTKVLYDAGLVTVKEPFQRLMNQGMLLANTPYRKPKENEKLEVGEDGILITKAEAETLAEDQVFYKWVKMSKSKGNVITPEEAVDVLGADAMRLYLLFVAPFEQEVLWSGDDAQGCVRFLGKLFRFAHEVQAWYDPNWRMSMPNTPTNPLCAKIRREVHKTIHKATQDIEKFAFNTYVSSMMTCLNSLNEALKEAGDTPSDEAKLCFSEAVETMTLLLSPAAPFSADELWESLGKSGFTYHADWPKWRAELAVEDTLKIAVQVNGKLRDTIEVAAGSSNAVLEEQAKASPKVQTHTDGKEIKKVIVVPGKLVNIVAV
ncbi:MAG: leucine--tRNA ligase [Fimbriimonadaceae bacterium]|nr:leucine--tRNA ligase [Fimbriimonadaceae bacterium]